MKNNHPSGFSTLIDILRWRASQQPEQRAYTFLVDGETEENYLTWGELDRQARVISTLLQDGGMAGERVLLLYPPGLEYIAAFWGCLYAGMIAVPSYPPRLSRPDARLQAISADAQATIALTTEDILSNLAKRFIHTPSLKALHWLATDNLDHTGAENWQVPSVEGRTLAFLQYTSGSTATPKGVMVSHNNLLSNLAQIAQCFEATADTRAVFWLPFYHDMGLIGGILETLYCSATSLLMSPIEFMKQPFRWLQAISRYKGTHSGGPNFAYDLCVREITPEQRATLDLSSWEVAFSGAEPVRLETLEQFAAVFGPCGFRREAFYPCYGLAEATLMVSGGLKAQPPVVRAFQKSALESNRAIVAPGEDPNARVLVSCGHPCDGHQLIIADPYSLTRCPPDGVGEVWISSPSVAQGYWHKPAETEYAFWACLKDTGEGPFLRTGDLGFLNQGEVFITGRFKDLIIIRGRNYYPQDIELTVQQSHPALQLNGGAAISVDIAGEERLIIIQEIRRTQRHVSLDQVVWAVRQAVAETYGLEAQAVVLIKPMSLPKTSSGKIQRHVCRARFLSETLEIVGQWTQDVEATAGIRESDSQASLPPAAQSAEAIERWLASQISQRLRIDPRVIDIQANLSNQGLSSLQAVRLLGDLENWLGRSVPLALIHEHPTISALAQSLSQEPTGESSAEKIHDRALKQMNALRRRQQFMKEVRNS